MGKQRLDVSGVNFTQQSAKAECDINVIVDRAKRGADLSQLSRGPGSYGHFIGLPDLREAMVLVADANEAFMALDASIRKRFDNEPALLLDFLNDPSNRDEAVRMGLLNAPVAIPEPVLTAESKAGDSQARGGDK